MKEQLDQIDWEYLYTILDVNKAWNIFRNTLLEIFDRNAPFIVKRVKGKFSPWLTTEIRQMMNSRDKALRKARRNNDEALWQTFKN